MEYLFPNIALIFSVMKFIDDTRYFIFTREYDTSNSTRSRGTDACERKKKRNEFLEEKKNFLQFELRVLFHEPFQRFRLKC